MRRLPLAWSLVSLLWMVPALFAAPDAAVVAELKQRFQQGVALEKASKLAEAREVFDGILKVDPAARGSLYYAGLVSVRLEDFSRAVDYLRRYREIDPKDPGALVLLIQSNQALQLNDKVEALRGELRELRKDPAVLRLQSTQSYAREKIHRPDGTYCVILEYFDPQQAPRRVWEMQVVRAESGTAGQLALLMPPAGASKPWRLVDYSVAQPGLSYTVVRQSSDSPDYATCRTWMLATLK